MAVLEGGIFSRPRGKTGGIVFGAARTRTGKMVTSRMLVPPSNPKTTDQMNQRNKFSDSLSIVRRLGSTIYQSDFNRSVGQLPGFQSMESIYLNQMAVNKDLTLVNPINLGVLHVPLTKTATAGVNQSIDVAWSDELGSNGTTEDIAVVLAVAKTSAARALITGIVINQSKTRSDQEVTITGLAPEINYQIYLYFKGAGNAAGLKSVANFLSATTGE